MSERVVRFVKAAVGPDPGGPADAELLRRFARTRDAGAFELLVWRHSGMVLAACRAVLRDRHLAEDASQAAFLALAKQAGRVRENPAGWLYRVARRIAAKQRRAGGVSPLFQSPATMASRGEAGTGGLHPPLASDDCVVLHQEVAALPDKYRLPVLLCFVEGLSHADAAARLGWPVGTVAGRIARAKDRLRVRLAARGLAPALAALAVTGTEPAFATVTARLGVAFAAGDAAGVAPTVLTLVTRVTRTMTLTKLAAALVILVPVVAGTGGLYLAARAERPPSPPPAPATAPEPTERRAARVEAGLLSDSPFEGVPGWTVAERLKHYTMPGASVAVVDDYRIAWSKGYGVADPAAGAAVTPDTLFDAGSVSKPVTALAALRLVEQGKLALDAPINNSLKSWKLPENEFTAKTPVTLRHLLTHTAGTSVSGFWGYKPDQPLPTVQQILDGQPPAVSGPVRVEHEPGTKWKYSGGGYIVIQQALTDVTGKGFPELIKELVFDPLGMTRSTFVQGLPPGLRPAAAKPASDASWFTGEVRTHPHMAAAGLYTTAPDLARFLIGVQTAVRGDPGSLVGRDTARLMATPAKTDVFPFDRTLGWRIFAQSDQAVGFFLHSRGLKPDEPKYLKMDGRNYGFISRVLGDLDKGRGVVVLVNSDNNDEFLNEVTRSVAREYGWPGYLPDPIKPAAKTAAELDAYCGRYRRTADNVLTIAREGDHLVWEDLYTRRHRLYPVGGDRFEHQELFGRGADFNRGADGAVASIRDHQQTYPRIAGDEVFPVELLMRGDIDAGVAALRKVPDLTAQRLADLGMNLLDTHNRPKAAEAVLRLGLERTPDAPPAWDALAGALRRGGDKEGAARAERKAEELRRAKPKQ